MTAAAEYEAYVRDAGGERTYLQVPQLASRPQTTLNATRAFPLSQHSPALWDHRERTTDRRLAGFTHNYTQQ